VKIKRRERGGLRHRHVLSTSNYDEHTNDLATANQSHLDEGNLIPVQAVGGRGKIKEYEGRLEKMMNHSHGSDHDRELVCGG